MLLHFHTSSSTYTVPCGDRDSSAEELVLAPESPGVNLRISIGKRSFRCNFVHRKREEYVVWGKEILVRAGDNMPSWLLWDHHSKDVPGCPNSGESLQIGWWSMWKIHIKLEREGSRAQLHAGSLEESTGLRTRSVCQDCLLLAWILLWITALLSPGSTRRTVHVGKAAQPVSFAVDEDLQVTYAQHGCLLPWWIQVAGLDKHPPSECLPHLLPNQTAVSWVLHFS